VLNRATEKIIFYEGLLLDKVSKSGREVTDWGEWKLGGVEIVGSENCGE
jgi:hypothetical protein